MVSAATPLVKPSSNSGNFTVAAFLDVAEAFHKKCHTTYVYSKLSVLEINPNVLKRMDSFLLQRRIFVYAKHADSFRNPASSGDSVTFF